MPLRRLSSADPFARTAFVGASPQFYYGCLSVAMAWQIVFLAIGSDPARFRPLMIPAIVDMHGYVLILAVLYGLARIPAMDAAPAVRAFG